MENNKRRERLISREFRDILGKNLRLERLKLHYSVKDISYMTTISVNTINTIEKGDATNIDYYIEYAKAVKYDFGKLSDFGIKLVPLVPLPAIRKEATQLTAKIRKFILHANFLGSGKTVEQIHYELIRLKQVTSTQVTSTEISGVIRNLSSYNIVKVGGKLGRKNLYVRVE